jgi:hypothetical protein
VLFYSQPEQIFYSVLIILAGGLILSVVLGSVRGVIVSFIAFIGFIFLRIARLDLSAQGLLLALYAALLFGLVALIVVVPAGYIARIVRSRRSKQKL